MFNENKCWYEMIYLMIFQNLISFYKGQVNIINLFMFSKKKEKPKVFFWKFVSFFVKIQERKVLTNYFHLKEMIGRKSPMNIMIIYKKKKWKNFISK